MAKKTLKTMVPYRSGAFLNLVEKDSGAMIVVKARGKLTGTGWEDNYSIDINDCEDKIHLHGKLRNPQSRANALFKINTLINHLTDLRDHIETQLQENNLRVDKKALEGQLESKSTDIN